MRRSPVVAVMFALAAAAQLSACTGGSSSTTPTSALPSATSSVPMSGGFMGTISGTVVFSGGPAHIARPGPRPVIGRRIQLVSLTTGAVVATAETDAKGRYTISTRAAEYTLTGPRMGSCELAGHAMGGPNTVVLPPQGVLTQDIRCHIR